MMQRLVKKASILNIKKIIWQEYFCKNQMTINRGSSNSYLSIKERNSNYLKVYFAIIT